MMIRTRGVVPDPARTGYRHLGHPDPAFLQGAFAGYIAPAQAYGVSIEAPSRRARLFAILQISTNVGSLLGAVAGGLILDYATFFWINIVASVLCAHSVPSSPP